MAHTLPSDVARWLKRQLLAEELNGYPDFKVSNTRESGLDRHSGHPAQPDPPTRKDRST